jgi:predicted  nucleic acid-binding Zn-ribbon protein
MLEVENKKVIEEVILKYPELMSESSKEDIKNKYYEIVSLKDKLTNLRMECITLENSLKEKEKAFRDISNTFELVFAKKTFNPVKGYCNTLIINPDDARN